MYVIGGKDPSEIVTNYTKLTGTMPVPPLWSLGYHQCRWSYYPEAKVKDIATTFRDKQIPCDGMWLDIGKSIDNLKIVIFLSKYSFALVSFMFTSLLLRIFSK